MEIHMMAIYARIADNAEAICAIRPAVSMGIRNPHPAAAMPKIAEKRYSSSPQAAASI